MLRCRLVGPNQPVLPAIMQYCSYSVIQRVPPTRKTKWALHEVTQKTCRPITYLEGTMPLPCLQNNGARRCHAIAKSTRNRCQNPAAYGCLTCRMHGARRRESIRKGPTHPNYRHGWDTKIAATYRKEKMQALAEINDIIESLHKKKRRGVP